MQRIRKWLWRATLALLVGVNVVLLALWRPYLRDSGSQKELALIGASFETQPLVRPLFENLAKRVVPAHHRNFLSRATMLRLPPAMKVKNTKSLGIAFQGLRSLRELNAHGNQHARLIVQASSGRMPSLLRIDLSASDVPDEELGEFDFPKLEILRLQDTQVSDEAVRHIAKKCDTLREPNLARTKISLSAVELCSQLPRLKNLDLHSTNLSQHVQLREGSLPALRELHVGMTGIDDTILAELILAAPNICYLDISGCAITDAGVVEALTKSRVESLNVSHLPISRDTLTTLGKIPSLKLLICSRDMVDATFRNELEAKFPRCVLFVRG